MRFRFVERLGLADAVTVANAAVGFLAVVAAAVDLELAARLVLLAAVADGLDGVVARHRGSTDAGPYLDSLADVASFGVAPATLVAVVVLDAASFASDPVFVAVGVGAGALFVATAVARLGLYTAYDSDARETVGVPTTLAATILAAAVIAGYTDPSVLIAATAAFALLMGTTVTYPDLHAQDALVMGVVQAAVILTPAGHMLTDALPAWIGEGFAFALLFLACGYLLLGPRFYWGDGIRSPPDDADERGV
ncbi:MULTISPECIES: protein sorting system archaetidylserine synthase [unclassified Halorubrum]|uniref:protein sorting system archaetidylserine synthase n=1 Tax=unclassified Halorubrum TaxID=2642239 RepID=UPI000B980660|nr:MULTISPECIES: protein sorting system archaetidylserine synthase [unclassified Halorubrum]OYR39994.1 CDP-diacylglycerol--serine O-phosphatidyltransferase [Halorubrum sp. Hd13]OYR42664.1 CDP-diacylglycerol--serine O-phosphatidyltransferase [Halorubrum sp. Eb13]OYR50567.1 CDP-diacylglycerol--serine O-phosphatidyltransferase [Halorubrum sp. Ea8]OYR53731.1 CDP-diacylglycerol--serine O-phosphatidyltransferase [Halorubrum sp. Ea1]